MGNTNQLEPEKILEFKTRQLAIDRANAEPLPGELKDAFGNTSILVEGLEVRAVVPSDWVILEEINSPLYQQHQETTGDSVKFTSRDGIEIIYQFTRPIKEVREVLRKGVEAFRETAMETIGDGKISQVTLTKLTNAVREQLQRTYSTALTYAQESNGEGKQVVRNFQEQPEPARVD